MNYHFFSRINPFKFSLLLGLALCTLTVSSCNTTNTTSDPQEAQSDGKNQLATDTQTKESRKIDHAMGTTTVEGTPQRVVVLTNEATDHALALGVKPVGAVKSWWGNPYFEYISSEMQGVRVVGEELQPNLERIAASNPDLIICSKVRHKNIYKRLSQIAPTVCSETLGADWKKNFTLYAKALNREEEGEEIMGKWNQRVADFKQKMGQNLNQKVSLVRFLPGKVRIYHKDNFAGKILEEVGLKRPEFQQKDKFSTEITFENIPRMDGDVLFYMAFNPQDGESGKLAQQWTNHPLWESLDVVQNNRVHQVNDVYWNTGAGIRAANKMLDDLYEYLLSS